MTDGYISDRDLKCSDCYIRNSCDLHPSTCNKRLSVFDEEGLKIHDAKVRADAIEELSSIKNFCDDCYMEFCEGCQHNGEYTFEIQKKLEQLKEQTKKSCVNCAYHFYSDCYLECEIHERVNNDSVCKDFLIMEKLKEQNNEHTSIL